MILILLVYQCSIGEFYRRLSFGRQIELHVWRDIYIILRLKNQYFMINLKEIDSFEDGLTNQYFDCGLLTQCDTYNGHLKINHFQEQHGHHLKNQKYLILSSPLLLSIVHENMKV